MLRCCFAAYRRRGGWRIKWWIIEMLNYVYTTPGIWSCSKYRLLIWICTTFNALFINHLSTYTLEDAFIGQRLVEDNFLASNLIMRCERLFRSYAGKPFTHPPLSDLGCSMLWLWFIISKWGDEHFLYTHHCISENVWKTKSFPFCLRVRSAVNPQYVHCMDCNV